MGMGDETPPVFVCERQARALDYWHEMRGEASLPCYRAFDPVEVPRLLPHLVVMDVVHDPADFRIRLIGEEVRAQLACNPVGLRLGEVGASAAGEALFEHARASRADGAPRYYALDCLGPDRSVMCQQGLMLPFTHGRGRVDKIIAVVSCRRKAAPGEAPGRI